MRQQSTFAVFVFAALTASGAFADAPSVTLTYPVANTTFSTNLTPAILLQAAAADADEPVLLVGFYVCPSNGTSCTSAAEIAGVARVPPYQVLWTPSHISSAGSVTTLYSAWAEAQNTLGQARQSSQVAFTVIQPPDSPIIYLIAPRGGRFVTPAAPVFYATAFAGSTSPPSSIARVDFLDGDTVIGTVTAPNSDPVGHGYAFAWNNPPLGAHLISGRVTDTLGYSAVARNSITGVPIQLPVSIVDPAPMQVGLSSPTTGQIFTPASSVPLTATVTGAQATVQRVDFVAGTVIVATAFRPPYSATWTNPPAGDFMLVARAVADHGVQVASPPAHIKVLTTSRPPSAVLTAPAPGATIASGAPLMLAADALAPDGSIGRVEFFAGTTLLGSATTAPYQFSWANPTVGALSLSAKAYDLQGKVGASAPVAVTVISGAVPVVSLTAPASGATFLAPATIGLSATASEAGGSIARVEFFANGSIVGTTTTAPYNFTWGSVAAGNYALTAKATDGHGATATSAAVPITVSNNQPPLVALSQPSTGQIFLAGQPIALSATASDPDGTVTRVDFLADGAVVGTLTTGPYTMMWNSATVGPHALTARATDNLGAPTTSTVVNITVAPHSLPTVTLTLPRTGQVFSAGALITVAAAAAAGEGTLARIEFYADGVLAATALTPPYSATWSGAAAGTHSLTAKAIDDVGAVTTSAGVTIQVVTPALTITTPAPNASVAADFVLVSGTYQGPPNSGITVNGVVASNDGQGRYFVNNLPLTDGSNTLTVTMTARDGQATTQTQTITSTATAPMQVYAEPDADFAPATYTVRLTNRTANTITHISYVNLGGGQLDTSSVDQTTLGKISYSTPGIYTPGFVITDSVGNTYTQTLAILAQDKAALDQLLKAVWGDFSNALATGNIPSAMAFFTGSAQVRYGPVLMQIAPSLAAAVANWEPLTTGTQGNDISEYTVQRVIGGIRRIYFVYFLRNPDGIWQLDSM